MNLIKLYKFLTLLLMLTVGVAQGNEVFSNKFESGDSVKAKGLRFSLEYPEGWEAADAESQNIVKKFVREKNGILDFMSVQVVNLNAQQVKVYPTITADQWGSVKCDFIKDADVSNVKTTRKDGEKAFVCDSKTTVDINGAKMYMANHIMTIFYKSKMIHLACGEVSGQVSKAELNRSFESLKPTCSAFFNKFTILDKHSK